MTASEQPDEAAAATPSAWSVARAVSPATTHDRARGLARARRHAIVGDELATERRHARGRLTARERLDALLDPGSFREIDLFRRRTGGPDGAGPATDGVVAGHGTIFGRRVFTYAQDFRVLGGSLGEAHAAKIHKVMDLAVTARVPLVSLHDSGGARIQEGVTALAGYGGIFTRSVRASGAIPQISVVLGPCAGGAAYSPALTDFTFMVRSSSHMFLTGPDVVQTVTGERVSHDGLGGAEVHASSSGVATFVHDDELACLTEVRYLLTLLPANCDDEVPRYADDDAVDRRCPSLAEIVPVDPKVPYDVCSVIEEIVDDGEFLQLHERWARSIVCALARMGGRTVGIVANQPLVRAGVLDIETCDKAARFVSMCDAFGIPLVTLVDVPGFLPGVEQEHQGVIRHGAKLLYAYCNASVPRVQVVLRKAYGGAYIVMDSRSIGADLSYAWPTNEIAVMGAAAAVAVLHRRELTDAEDPEPLRAKLIADYVADLMHPFYASERGLVDDVIDPADTRSIVIEALELLVAKRPEASRRKHGNPPV